MFRLLTECPYKRQTLIEGHLMNFYQTLVFWPTHRWGWLPTIFFVWGPPCGWGSPTPNPILLVTSKFFLTTPRGLEWSICYILVKTLMGNFKFRPWPAIFWRGPSLKKFSEILAFRWVTPPKNGLMTPKWKSSYILVKTLMANFQFGGHWTIFWRGHSPKS